MPRGRAGAHGGPPRADPGGTIEGTWTSETVMSESAREGGVCTLSVEPRQLRLECSPGARRTRFELRVLDRAGAKTTIETVGDGGAGERLEVETLAGPGGRRALRIVVAGRPGSTPLGAYGRPDLWVEAPAGEAR